MSSSLAESPLFISLKKLDLKTKIIQICVGLVTFVMGAYLLYGLFYAPDIAGDLPMMILAALFGALFVGVGGLLLVKSFQPNLVLKAIVENPSTVVWIYKHQVVYRGGAPTRVANLMVGLSNGKLYPFMTTPELADQMMAALQKELPRVVVGFSSELEKKFRQDPVEFHA